MTSPQSDRLQRLSAEQGQSPWVDNLKRSYLEDGTLAALVQRGIKGVTSNPTIFQKAIAGSADYDAQFRSLLHAGTSIPDSYWAIVLDDIANACDVLAPVHAATNGADGYVSIEVSPTLADDSTATIVATRDLAARVNRPNLMVKIPATLAGVEAVRQTITEGYDINVTLIFSLERYAAIIEAYISGLEARLAAGTKDLSTTASVASFFISRVDTEIDRRLDKIGSPDALALRGRAAVAQAVLAYHLFGTCFSGPRWDRLREHGARVQRPLWASTSTKNPAYPDTLYVDSLIGPDTVNTLPEPTIEAFTDHGSLARTVDTADAVAEAVRIMRGLADMGVDLADVATTLEAEGVASFAKSFDELLTTLETHGHELTKT